jgi:hypothetical protein
MNTLYNILETFPAGSTPECECFPIDLETHGPASPGDTFVIAWLLESAGSRPSCIYLPPPADTHFLVSRITRFKCFHFSEYFISHSNLDFVVMAII